MSTFIADHLTAPVLASLAQNHAAIVVCTIDEHGWPHPAMLSAFEVVARDPSNIRLGFHVSSRSTRNLKENGRATLVLADEHGVFYVKGDVLLRLSSLRSAPHIAKFNLRVDSVLADDPHQHESARIVSGISFERGEIDAAALQAVRDELMTD